jgi:hypothetical protein
VKRRKHHKLKMMPNQNRSVFPNRRRRAPSPYRHHPNYRVLVPCPRTYFEVKDIRPGDDELSEYTFEIFELTDGGLTIPKELNRKIVQYLPGKDLLRFSMASKKALWNVEFSHAFMYDTIHERIEDLVKELRSSLGWMQRQPNEHKFRVGNCVRARNFENGYVVRVTPKIVFYVTETDIFKRQPQVRRIGNDNGAMPMRPYYAAVLMEFVKNWRTWVNMMEEFPYRD